jgi:hypothetical protein
LGHATDLSVSLATAALMTQADTQARRAGRRPCFGSGRLKRSATGTGSRGGPGFPDDQHLSHTCMVIFESEQDLLRTIAEHDELVRRCVLGHLSFPDFCAEYKDFYANWALDGHESDDEERALLEKHERLVEPHRIIAFDVLSHVCSDADAELESYRLAGRFGSRVAMERLKAIRLSPA